MDSIKIDKKNEVKEKNNMKILFEISSIVFMIFSFINFNLPFTIKINEKIYNIFLTKLIFVKYFNYNDIFIKFPDFLRISSMISILFMFISIYFFIKKSKMIYISLIPIFINLLLILCLKYFINSDLFVSITNPNVFLISILLLCISIIFMICSNDFKKIPKFFFSGLTFFSVFFMFSIAIYIFTMGMPAIIEVGLKDFIFGTIWQPSDSLFGIWPLIVASAASAGGSIILGAPLGVLTAVYLTFYSPKWLFIILKMLTRVLAGIPSVVFGFFGMTIVVPFIRKVFYGYSSGDSLLAAIIILSIMILPTIINISEDALKSVPSSFEEAALALGDTKIKTIFKIILPAASQGIFSAILLGISRSIGETMAVIMVSGNIPRSPELLKSARFLTTGISLEMAYSSGLHRKVLFAIGLVLFIFVFIINLFFIYVSDKTVLRK